ncbi:MAG: urease accessory protein UreF [Chloroflexota bacterium]
MMRFESAQLLMLLQWTDSAFPTGAFAHSGALETYAQDEIIRTPSGLAELIAMKLESAARTDLIVIHTAMSAYANRDESQIVDLDQLCSASKLARETRDASEKIGRRMLASVLNLMDDSLLRWYQAEIAAGRCAGHHSVVHGLACAAQNIEPRTALLAFVYALAANQTMASLKLMSIGQTQAQVVLGGLHEQMAVVVDAALNRTLDDFGSFTPGLDIRAVQHEHLFRRLFIS